MSRESAILALSRFGMGARPGEVHSIAADPRGWAEAQLGPYHPPAALAALPDAARLLTTLRGEMRKDGAKAARAAYVAEAAARTRLAASSAQPLVERLVRLWSNHFTVSIARGIVAPVAGAFEREAIRPHALGRFRDLLGAAVTHPAMLLYLDNTRSVGPDSAAGRARGKGLNENHARELLELHTLGADAPYDQSDVEAVAQALTGWGLDERTGVTRFAARRHQPGPLKLLGQPLRAEGEGQLAEVLDRLAAHPATARHVALRMARHFTADQPAAGLVEQLARVFLDSGGDLRAVTQTLLSARDAWEKPFAKLRSPDDLVVAALRLLGPELIDDARLVRSLSLLGQGPWNAPSPAGWPDAATGWISPDALMRRLEWCRAVARRAAAHGPAAPDLADGLFPVGLSSATRQALAGAPRRDEALFLLLASSEFQRR